MFISPEEASKQAFKGNKGELTFDEDSAKALTLMFECKFLFTFLKLYFIYLHNSVMLQIDNKLEIEYFIISHVLEYFDILIIYIIN